MYYVESLFYFSFRYYLNCLVSFVVLIMGSGVDVAVEVRGTTSFPMYFVDNLFGVYFRYSIQV